MISNPVYIWLGGTIKVIYVYDISCVLQNMQVMASLQIIESEGEEISGKDSWLASRLWPRPLVMFTLTQCRK